MSIQESIITLVVAIIASGGFWTALQFFITRRDKRKEKKDGREASTQRMILGLGHERIIEKCNEWLTRGSIRTVEYGDFLKYLWEPYKSMGGNGTAEELVERIRKLPFIDD